MHGYLCRRHHERSERAWSTLGQLRQLLAGRVLRRARTTESSASTTAGPRIAFLTLQLDLDELERTWSGDVTTHDGAIAALLWERDVHVLARRHAIEPKREGLHRAQCASCAEMTIVTEPPTIAGGDSLFCCVKCGRQTANPDHVEAAAFTEALERDPYRPRRRTIARVQPAGLDQRAGIAALAG